MSEMLGTLFKYLMAALALVGVIFIVTRAFSSDRTTTAAAQVSQIATSVRQLYSGYGSANFTTLSNTVAINGGTIPAEMLNGDTKTINGPWAGSIVTVGGSATQFNLQYTNIAGTDCAKFVRGVQFLTASVNGTTITFPADGGTIASACNVYSLNTVNFSFTQ
jgi:hypothetical protein